MVEFADRISQVPRDTTDVQAVLFADDVLLSAKSPEGLENLLDIASVWVQDYKMVWNTKPGKSRVLLSTDTSSQRFILAGKPLTKVKEITYLGVPLSSSGVSDSMMMDRIHMQ